MDTLPGSKGASWRRCYWHQSNLTIVMVLLSDKLSALQGRVATAAGLQLPPWASCFVYTLRSRSEIKRGGGNSTASDKAWQRALACTTAGRTHTPSHIPCTPSPDKLTSTSFQCRNAPALADSRELPWNANLVGTIALSALVEAKMITRDRVPTGAICQRHFQQHKSMDNAWS